MPEKDTGPEAAAKGIVEDVKGKAKEAVGAVTNNDDLRDEGESWSVLSPPEAHDAVLQALGKAGIESSSAEIGSDP